MSIFELFLKLNHPSKKAGWIETRAVFTGKVEKAAVGKPGHYHEADYYEYEIKYSADDEERMGWYVFHPSPEPDPEDIKGTCIRIRYNRKKPWSFEVIPEEKSSER
jgi:hypothetical protein